MNHTTFTDVATELSGVAANLRLSTVKVRSGSGGAGSGVIWQADGLIITNAHVAISAEAIVELSDGRVFEAVRTHFDPQQDLAALKINATGLPCATIGDADTLRVGNLVLAVGNPFADSGAVTTGIIHSRHQQAILADLRLYPGNSGGSMADCLGRVIGINTMIANGLAVAIPSNTVQRFLQNLPKQAGGQREVRAEETSALNFGGAGCRGENHARAKNQGKKALHRCFRPRRLLILKTSIYTFHPASTTPGAT